MKIRDIILETAAESRELQTVAKKIADYIVSRDGNPGTFTARDAGVSGREDAVARALNAIKFSMINEPDTDDIAYYDHNTRSIQVNWPRVEEEAEELNLSTQAELSKTLVHELQHAVDGTKSGGRALMHTTSARSGETDDEQFVDYLQLPHEVNARFAEALDDINDQLPYVREAGQLPAIINDAFAKREINRAFPDRMNDPKYRRLVTRAYQFYAEQLKNDSDPSVARAQQFILKK